MNPEKLGVSIVVCCFNSSKLLPETLSYILQQDVPESFAWEVIIINNASTDNTRATANSILENTSKLSFKIIDEPKPGLIFARISGINASMYEFISFVDDDNWLDPKWVKTVFDIMINNNEIGACGGPSSAYFQSKEPDWFTLYSSSFAVGNQFEESADITWDSGHLWGAGLTIRKSAWKKLRKDGFQSSLVGRKGDSLSSGEDYELCYALRLNGWKLWYDDRVKLTHFITSERLNTIYLKKLFYAFGRQTIELDPYELYMKYRYEEIPNIFNRKWLYRLVKEIYKILVKNKSLFYLFYVYKQDSYLKKKLQLNKSIASIRLLIKIKNKYDNSISLFYSNKWIKIDMNKRIGNF